MFVPVLLAAEILVTAPGAAAETPDAGANATKPAAARQVKVTSDKSQYLRKDGILAFMGNVFVDDVEFKMHADEVTIFLQGTNELKRIIAIGNVAVTNELRNGTCLKAVYSKEHSTVVLYGDKDKPARLNDEGKNKASVEGRRITLWTDTQQVEVEGSSVTVDASGSSGADGFKKQLGL